MDINALLSPENSPVSERRPLPSNTSPRKSAVGRQSRPAGSKRTASSLSQEVKRSPDRILSPASRSSSGGIGSIANLQQAFPILPISEAAPRFRPLQQHVQFPPTSSPSTPLADPSRGYGGYVQQPQRPGLANRHSSTPQMETLAELASMQHRHQATRTHSFGNLRHSGPAEAAQRSIAASAAPSGSSHQPPPLVRNASGQSLADITMAEAPAQTPPPRNFTSNALSETESQTVTDLLSYLGENSYAYDSHVQLVQLLHKGFLSHTYPPADAADATPRDPHSYGLLRELRQSREAMDSRFAVGEEIWLDWLADEVVLARSGEERITVTELYQKAVGDEPASVKLWQAYANWVESNYRACSGLEGVDQAGWTAEDKEMCRELFTREMLLNVLEQGAAATQWRIDESHLLWNRYAELMLPTLSASPSQAEVERVRDIFLQRLQLPHLTSRQTAQEMFWPIVNKYYPESWEAIMDQVNEVAEPVRRQVALREEHELTLLRAVESGDKDAVYAALSAYLQWERKQWTRKQHNKKHKDRAVSAQELYCGLYERALLAFPTYTEWWLDYIDLVISTTGSSSTTSVLPLIERATRHCPWSGDLWAKRILRADVECRPHVDIEATKHRATNSGLLDVGGMEELLKVLQQWCSYLRRHAFSPQASEDDLDTTEVGITMAIEDILQAGKTLYGADFKGDPLYRLETIQIKFFTEGRRLADAREIYKRLVDDHKHEADFWAKYYAWELMIWGCQRLAEQHRMETPENGPHLVTAVVQKALSQDVKLLDWPEKVLEMYLNHFQQHESGEKLQAAQIEAREFGKRLAIRRAKEAEAVAAAQPQQQDVVAAQVSLTGGGEKRKAEEALTNGETSKKAKTGETPASAAGFNESSSSASAQIKRDREHNTVTVRNLPVDVSEDDIKKFFRDVGQPISTNILQDKASGTASATVEFESYEDVLAAKTRNGREIREGFGVRIASGSQNTLYVANYPAEYDEQAIRRLFDSYGEIISVRFPSLKFNNRRRFCYVQFFTEEMAREAEAKMDNKALDAQHRLLAKVSNPDAKKQRSGAQAEGRELFVKNIHREASDAEVTEFFGRYGDVVSINLLKLVNNKRTGTGFIVFASAEESSKALEADGKPFRDRILHVEVSATKAEGRTAPMDRARKTDVIIKSAGGTAGSPEAEGTNGRRGSDVSMASADAQQQEAFRTARERKIAIFNLPDTVNDARVRTAMEAYGPIVKIQLRRDQGGAIVEFVQIKDAFNVRSGVDVSSLGPEAKTGDVADLLGKKKKGPGAPAGGAGSFRPTNVSRPGQARGGRRGGLGFKRGGFGGSAKGGNGSEAAGGSGTGGGGRSNADFRAMFEAGRPASGKAAEDGAGGES